ncbi:MAG: alanine racemase [Rhodothermales bacterium]|jgi:D-serine deaminase-like pyridoxal phosphate-dependent protein
MFIHDLPTPCVLIEQTRLESNIAGMAARAGDNQVILRPHVKTHKSIALARRQIGSGAKGITVAKPSEAAVFAHAGFSDIRIAYATATQHHFESIADLMDRSRISFCVDTMDGANAASEFFHARGMTAGILVEVDCGYGRCGVAWDDPDALDFVRVVSALPGLDLLGILTHAGHAYGAPGENDASPRAAVARIAAEERDRMLTFASHLFAAGAVEMDREHFEISIGSTPTMSAFKNESRDGLQITEIRPGNYIFNDAIQVALGVAPLRDCALTVLASVISKHRDRHGSHERLFLDAGRKILTSDTGFGTDGFGTILHSATTMNPLPHARINKLSEEHGWVDVPGGSTFSVGDRVRIVPNHACVVVNTQHALHIVDGETRVMQIAVDAQGCVT